MLTIKVPLGDSQQVKEELLRKNVLAKSFALQKDSEFIYFPVKHTFPSTYDFVEKELAERTVKPTLKDALIPKIPQELHNHLKTSYDQVGSIAIVEVDDELRPYEKLIGETLLRINKQVATVLAKDAHHEGVFRTQKMRLLGGKDTRVGIHKENSVLLKVNVEEVYFSARLATERKRILEQVRPGEKVLVMFSGCGPYSCVMAKKCDVTAVDINPEGYKLAVENAKRNKVKVRNICGDVRDVVPKEVFDRILMPLPKDAEDFLDVALGVSKDTIIHFYAFLHEERFSEAEQWIADACRKAKKKYEILRIVKCGQQAPRVFRICVDFKVSEL